MMPSRFVWWGVFVASVVGLISLLLLPLLLLGCASQSWRTVPPDGPDAPRIVHPAHGPNYGHYEPASLF